MPRPKRSLKVSDVVEFARNSFSLGALERAQTQRVGAEIEFLTVSSVNPLGIVSMPTLEGIARQVQTTGRVTFEPGGQIEISSTAAATLDECIRELASDYSGLESAFGQQSVGLRGVGMDPVRPPERVLRAPRYDAMEAFFDQDGSAGRWMMNRTASIQINLDFGIDPEARWRRTHRIGPVMAAMFANSPFYCGAASGWKSSRLWNWSVMDHSRTSAVAGSGHEAWAKYLLDARVMMVRTDPDFARPMLRPLTFGGWMEDGDLLGWPDLEDLAYHATTVFPPIRPRGHLEIRATDALPDPWWVVPIAAWTTLLYSDLAFGEVRLPTNAWALAARHGLSEPHLGAASKQLMTLVLENLLAVSSDARVLSLVQEFADRWTFRQRTPADDAIDAGGAFELDKSSVMKAAWV